MAYLFYIDGAEVSGSVALKFIRQVYTNHLLCVDEATPEQLWARRRTEEGREYIHNVTAIHELGGLEIVKED